jgi:hypothetical protein
MLTNILKNIHQGDLCTSLFLNIQNLMKTSAILPKITKNGVMHRSIMVPSSGIIDFDLWFGLRL